MSISISSPVFSMTGVTGVLNPPTVFWLRFPRSLIGVSSSPTSLDGSGVNGAAGRASTRFVADVPADVVAVALEKNPKSVVCLPADFGG